MKRVICLAILLMVAIAAVAQEKRGPSTPEERARVVQIAKSLVENPTSPNAANDREWITIWLIEVPDISVSVCSATLTWESKYKYASELMAAQLAAEAAYIIQNPDKAKDQLAVAQAGMEASLKAYSKIVEQNPKAHSKKMDQVVDLISKSTVSDYLKTNWEKSCK